MLSDKSTVCPVNLLNIAHQKRGVKAAVVNAGKKLPKNADIVIHFHSIFLIVKIFLHAIKKIKIEENIILNEPSWEASRPTKAFFIKINELPHINDKAIK